MLQSAGLLGFGLAAGDPSALWAAAHGRRRPGSRPHPKLPIGTDTIPEIEHVIVLMMENHSFDNYFGMLGRGDGLRRRNGAPTNANVDAAGTRVTSFHMPTTCQQDAHPSQAWNASHIAYDRGRNAGFARASGPVAMGYWTDADLPFYHGLARTFPVADRWFGACLGQTYPNRRFLLAGTAAGIVSTTIESLTAPAPPNGNLLERLDAYGIEWRDYYTDLPGVAVLLDYATAHQDHLRPIGQYFIDAAAGTLPPVTFVDPSFATESEENPQDIQRGEAFAARVINAAMQGPGWSKTLLVWCYDEHGGYYDHVPPPRAVKPDDIAPRIDPVTDEPGGYDRYGFRVPAVVVSPYARRNHVSHRVRDHTAVMKFIETKWNLPALTFRDANADALLDCLDFHRPPAFLDPPVLPVPGYEAASGHCTPGEPGPIPPALAPAVASDKESAEAAKALLRARFARPTI